MPPQGRRRVRDDSDEGDSPRPRQRRSRNQSEDEDEDVSAEESMAVDGGDTQQSADDILAKKLVRYALSCEYARVPLRRDGIKERVLGDKGRSWKRIFALAQTQLKLVWGMEIRELPVRERLNLNDRRKAMASTAREKTGSGIYIVCSVLPNAYRSAAIIPPSKIPSKEEEATYVGFCNLIVSCIWLSSGELSDQKLKRFLVRLNADRNVSNEKTDATLKKMERQGYVTKKVERPAAAQDGEQTVHWLVGPRAKEEIGLDGVMGMAREVYGGSTPGLERKLKASLRIKDRALDEDEEAGDGEGDTVVAADVNRDESE